MESKWLILKGKYALTFDAFNTVVVNFLKFSWHLKLRKKNSFLHFSENPKSPSLLFRLEDTLLFRLDLKDSVKLL